jgi:hypothetical protein
LSANDFDQVFGPTKPSFAAKLGRAEPAPPNGKAKDESTAGAQYKPYGFLPTGTINETCEVVRWIEGTEIPEGVDCAYRFLTAIGFTGEEQLRLFFPDFFVVIEGQHLRDLRKKLARRQVTFIQQYNARVWRDSPRQGEPIIEKIKVVRPDLGA